MLEKAGREGAGIRWQRGRLWRDLEFSRTEKRSCCVDCGPDPASPFLPSPDLGFCPPHLLRRGPIPAGTLLGESPLGDTAPLKAPAQWVQYLPRGSRLGWMRVSSLAVAAVAAIKVMESLLRLRERRELFCQPLCPSKSDSLLLWKEGPLSSQDFCEPLS